MVNITPLYDFDVFVICLALFLFIYIQILEVHFGSMGLSIGMGVPAFLVVEDMIEDMLGRILDATATLLTNFPSTPTRHPDLHTASKCSSSSLSSSSSASLPKKNKTSKKKSPSSPPPPPLSGRIVQEKGDLYLVVSGVEHMWANFSQVEAAGLGSELERWNKISEGAKVVAMDVNTVNIVHFNPLLLALPGPQPSSSSTSSSSSSQQAADKDREEIAESADTLALNTVLRATSLLLPKSHANIVCARGTRAVTRWMMMVREKVEASCWDDGDEKNLGSDLRSSDDDSGQQPNVITPTILGKAVTGLKFPVGKIGSKIVSKFGKAHVLATSRAAVICISGILQ